MCLGDFEAECVCAVDPDKKNLQMIVPPEAGYAMDDMVFDRSGGFYFMNFKGYSTEPTDGIFYINPDFQTITPAPQNLATPNGIALATDEKGMWVTEMGKNLLYIIELSTTKPASLITVHPPLTTSPATRVWIPAA